MRWTLRDLWLYFVFLKNDQSITLSTAWFPLCACGMMSGGGNVAKADSVDDSDVCENKTNKTSKLSNVSGVFDRKLSRSNHVDIAKINTLKASVNKHYDVVTKFLLTSKETAEKRSQLEIAFRVCKDAFLEMATSLAYYLENGSATHTIGDVKLAVREVMEDFKANSRSTDSVSLGKVGFVSADVSTTYASVAATSAPKVRVSRGPTLEIPTSTTFMIVPDEKNMNKYNSSQATREAVCKTLRPSECALKVNKITNIDKNGIKIDAVSPNIEKIKTHPDLARIGLKVVENVKFNPRLIVHGVPAELTPEEIREDVIAQNLNGDASADLKVVYVYQPKIDKKYTSCVLQVSPNIRRQLLNSGHIYLRYSACRFADHIRILQCFKCLTFGHIAKDCKATSICGHCSGSHEIRNCNKRDKPPTCGTTFSYGCKKMPHPRR